MTRLWPLLLALLILAAWVAVLLTLTQPPHVTSAGLGEDPALVVTPGAPPPEADRPAPPVPGRSATPHTSRSRRVPARLDVTAYCYTGHRTASGLWPREGMAAGNRWPFGTRLRVEHIGVVTVTDRIGWGSDLDLYMSSCAAARRFGRQHLTVEVVR